MFSSLIMEERVPLPIKLLIRKRKKEFVYGGGGGLPDLWKYLNEVVGIFFPISFPGKSFISPSMNLLFREDFLGPQTLYSISLRKRNNSAVELQSSCARLCTKCEDRARLGWAFPP